MVFDPHEDKRLKGNNNAAYLAYGDLAGRRFDHESTVALTSAGDEKVEVG